MIRHRQSPTWRSDAAWVRDTYPLLRQQATFLEQSLNAQGLFELRGAWHFLDWSRIEGNGWQTAPHAILAHESMLAVVALEATAEFAEIAAAATEAAHWHTLAANLRDATQHTFWSVTEGAYVDAILADGQLSTHFSQATNVAALFAA
ncbi:MAG: hypothetical protein H0X24_10115, partial [Ktedonobacterales bacterium]|nr:hypothetical protein [Ktedonobacterales bacterium]